MLLFKRGIFLFSIFLLLLGMTGGAEGAIIRVPKDHNSIQKGINAAQKGDTVRISKGHYYENVTLKKKRDLARRMGQHLFKTRRISQRNDY